MQATDDIEKNAVFFLLSSMQYIFEESKESAVTATEIMENITAKPKLAKSFAITHASIETTMDTEK